MRLRPPGNHWLVWTFEASMIGHQTLNLKNLSVVECIVHIFRTLSYLCSVLTRDLQRTARTTVTPLLLSITHSFTWKGVYRLMSIGKIRNERKEWRCHAPRLNMHPQTPPAETRRGPGEHKASLTRVIYLVIFISITRSVKPYINVSAFFKISRLHKFSKKFR